MLRPQVPELVEQASALGIKVTMTTNGTLIDKGKAKRLVEGGLRGVNISIDSPIRKMHEKIRGVEGCFKATAKAVELFRRYKHKGKLTIRINTVISRTNYQTLETIAARSSPCGRRILRSSTARSPRRSRNALWLSVSSFRIKMRSHLAGQTRKSVWGAPGDMRLAITIRIRVMHHGRIV